MITVAPPISSTSPRLSVGFIESRRSYRRAQRYPAIERNADASQRVVYVVLSQQWKLRPLSLTVHQDIELRPQCPEILDPLRPYIGHIANTKGDHLPIEAAPELRNVFVIRVQHGHALRR